MIISLLLKSIFHCLNVSCSQIIFHIFIFHGYVANSYNDQLLAGLEAQVLRGCVVAFQVSNLVENNERIYDTRHGGFVQFKDRQGKT